MIPIGVNMISIIRINYKSATYNLEENRQNKLIVKQKIKRIILLFALLIIVMFLSFFFNYIITTDKN